ncbi:ATP-binding cassette domain-containing protein [Pseudonocardia spinosispora]|uniref:ATP-binding cassette domain-containing protein n=1 Tax=Pseudonocardia spinosispora TaxID=103441 RepID=UPI0007E8D6C7|nr:ATP-binding cassette domain-containing protein [Pseudonocardia spinosispora]
MTAFSVRDLSFLSDDVQPLSDISFWARAGEITALVGGHGAGKSALVRCLSGMCPPTSGQVLIDDRSLRLSSVKDAHRAGIETVHQGVAVAEELAVWQNLFLNRELRTGPFLDRLTMQAYASVVLAELAVDIPSAGTRVRKLSRGQRRAMAVCRADLFDARTVIIDDPTASLSAGEAERVEQLIRRLRRPDRAVLFLSPDFEQGLRLSEQIWVMRAGQVIGGRRSRLTTSEEIGGMLADASR